jgi:hypothetical protein
MPSTKIRTTIIALVASASFGVAAVAPAVSQAQWHTYCVSGHCITHTNFTEGGVSPCVRINGQLGKAQQAVGDYTEWKNRHDAGEATATKELENAEAEVNRASGEAFEYGCDVAAQTAPTSVVVAPVGAVQGSPEGGTLPPVQGSMVTSSPLPAL